MRVEEEEWRKATFLIDSGAEISIIATDQETRENDHEKNVVGIGGRQKIGAKKCFQIKFDSEPSQVFDVQLHPANLGGKKLVILGRDFLKQFGETEFNWDEGKIRLGETWIFLAEVEKSWHINPDLTAAKRDQIMELIERYPNLFASNPRAPRECLAVSHDIRSRTNQTVRCKVRRLPMKWADNINEQVTEMVDNGIIVPSNSPYNSSPLLVKRKDGKQRFVIDFRELNKTTVSDSYPLPNVEELIDQTFGCRYFTQLDLASGYWAIPISEDDRCKTAFSVPRGKFEFTRMPFGLKNAQATFQRNSDKIVQTCQGQGAKGLDSYVDNFIIATDSWDEHVESVGVLLEILEEFNMSLRKDKCEFGLPGLEFLGFYINGSEIRPAKANIDKILEFPEPTSRKKLQSFLGLANYNRRFIQSYSELCKPLNVLTSTKQAFEWTGVQQTAFAEIKKRFHAHLSLALPDWTKPFVVKTDASKIAVGSVLGQFGPEGEFKPVGYHSETLSKAAQKWHTTEREFYGIISASRKWKAYCCENITFYTDHEPLKKIRDQKDPRGKIGRWILELENLEYTIKYLKGKDNIEADCMSRTEMANSTYIPNNEAVYNVSSSEESPPRLQLPDLAEEQRKDTEISSAVLQLQEAGRVSKGPWKNYVNLNVEQGVLYKGKRMIIPASLTEEIIREYHGQGHIGAENTYLTLASRFYWRGMKGQTNEFVSNCRTCKQCKPGPKPKAEVQDHRDVSKLFEMISMDIGSMPCSKKGNSYFLLITDNFSKLSTAVPLANAKGDALVDSLWANWFGYYGIPKLLQSDQGSNVDGKAVRRLCEALAIRKIRSSTYHPAGNGSAERAIGFMKTLLRAMCHSRNVSIHCWDTILPEAILIFNSTKNSSTQFSPFQVAYGTSPNTPLDNKFGINQETVLDANLVRANVSGNREDARAVYQKQANKTVQINEFENGDLVLLKRTHGSYPKMNPHWVGPFRVEKKVGPVNWAISDPTSGKTKIVHHDLIKQAGAKQDASCTLLHAQAEDARVRQVTRGSALVFDTQRSTPPLELSAREVDHVGFRGNVFNENDNGNGNDMPHPAPTSSTTITRAGRVSRPPSRLIDELSQS